MSQRHLAFPDEAASSELDLLRQGSDKLRTAAGFVHGAILASTGWCLLGVLTWLMVA